MVAYLAGLIDRGTYELAGWERQAAVWLVGLGGGRAVVQVVERFGQLHWPNKIRGPSVGRRGSTATRSGPGDDRAFCWTQSAFSSIVWRLCVCGCGNTNFSQYRAQRCAAADAESNEVLGIVVALVSRVV